MSQFLTSGGQSTGASASASVLPMNIQDWFPLQWTDWISLKSKGLSRIFSSTPHLKSINTLALSFLYSLPLTSRHDYWKNHSFLDLVMLSVQFSPLIWVRFFVTPWIAARQASLSILKLKSTQTHVHRVGDAIQPYHPLPSPSPPTLNLSQHQSLFKWVSSSHQVAKILELQHQPFQWIFRVDFL